MVDKSDLNSQIRTIFRLRDQGRHSAAISLAGELEIAIGENTELAKITGNLYASIGEYSDAIIHYQRAVRLDCKQPHAYLNLAKCFSRTGNLALQLETLNEAIRENPDNIFLLNEAGFLYTQLNLFERAQTLLTKSQALRSPFAETNNYLALLYSAMGDTEKAMINLELAISQDPRCSRYHRNLLEVLEKSNRLDELAEALTRAVKFCDDEDPMFNISRARLLYEAGKLEDAKSVLLAVLINADDRYALISRASMLCDIFDQLGDCSQAFQQALLAKAESKKLPLSSYHSKADYLAMLKNRYGHKLWLESQPTAESSFAPLAFQPVFLVGFPRSGTTLLDTILRSHSCISVIEEQSAVGQLVSALDKLQAKNQPLSVELVESFRSEYQENLCSYLESAKFPRIVVDKMPLHILHTASIIQIFPEAKFIFALRHPCDCVLSCLFKTFDPNPAMVNFLTLEGAANFYDETMKLWTHYQSTMELDLIYVRYEDLVSSFQPTLEPLLKFLKCDWEDELKNYRNTAISRDRIATPSYKQVTQALYSRATGRWLRYREEMEPVLPILQKWSDHWGYSQSN